MSELKKRKLIILNKEKEQAVIDLCDIALKGAGMQALHYVNAVANAVEEEEIDPPKEKCKEKPPAEGRVIKA